MTLVRPIAAIVLSSLAFMACSDISSVRVGVPRSARGDTCDLDVISSDMSTFAQYEQVGIVTLSNASGTDPMSPEARALVRPRACALGGEAIAVMSSAGLKNGFGMTVGSLRSYTVWAKRTTGPATPQKF
jgi:hypothetical protein